MRRAQGSEVNQFVIPNHKQLLNRVTKMAPSIAFLGAVSYIVLLESVHNAVERLLKADESEARLVKVNRLVGVGECEPDGAPTHAEFVERLVIGVFRHELGFPIST